MKRIAYLSYPCFSDTDFSLIHEMNKKVEVYYFISMTPSQLKGAAINIREQYYKAGIFKAADIYPEIQQFGDILNMENTYVINLLSHKSLTNFYISVKLLILFIKLKIDLIHAADFYPFYYIILYLFRKKTCLTVHDPFPHSSEHKKHFYGRKAGFLLMRNFIILNKKQKYAFISHYKLEHKNVFVSQLGVYNYLCRYKKDSIQNSSKEYILFFGQIKSYKGLEFLFPAMKQVHQKFPKVHLIIAGKGDFHFEISEYQSYPYFDIRNRFIPYDELVDLIQKSLFVVCPYNDATQSGVIMSAFAFHKPVLATNVGSLPDVIENMQSGIIIPPKNIDALVKAMCYLLDHKEILIKQEDYIKEKYLKGENSWNSIAANIVNFYNQIYA